jgi:hypothetical protein
MLIRIESSYFVAGVELKGDLFDVFTVFRAAPILSYMKGWSYDRVKNYCTKKEWSMLEVK